MGRSGPSWPSSTAWAALGEPQLEEETRTDIVGVLESLLDVGVETALIVTDGVETAEREIREIGLLAGASAVLILVPAADKYGARNATEKAAEGWRAAGVRAIPYAALVTPSAWAGLTDL